MNHLSFEEITDFVSLTELNAESLALASKVNGHICRCQKCLDLVRAFQRIYDEFCELHTRCSFKEYIPDRIDITLQELSSREITPEREVSKIDHHGFDR